MLNCSALSTDAFDLWKDEFRLPVPKAALEDEEAAEVTAVTPPPVLEKVVGGLDTASMQLDCFSSFVVVVVVVEAGCYCCTVTFLASGGSYGFLGSTCAELPMARFSEDIIEPFFDRLCSPFVGDLANLGLDLSLTAWLRATPDFLVEAPAVR